MTPGERPKKREKLSGEKRPRSQVKPPTRRRGKRDPGRPPVVLDPAQIHALGTIHCTLDEAAHVLGVSIQTLHAKFHAQPELRDAWERGQAHGKTSLRRSLFSSALGSGVKRETRILSDGTRIITETTGVGNVTAQIWLSKQHLGMKDVQVVEHEGGTVTLFDLLVGSPDAKLIGSSSDADADADAETSVTPPPPIDERH